MQRTITEHVSEPSTEESFWIRFKPVLHNVPSLAERCAIQQPVHTVNLENKQNKENKHMQLSYSTNVITVIMLVYMFS